MSIKFVWWCVCGGGGGVCVKLIQLKAQLDLDLDLDSGLCAWAKLFKNQSLIFNLPISN